LDSHEIGLKAAKCIIETIRGNFVPTMAFRKPKIVSASVFQASEFHPMKKVYDRCREWEEKGIYCASVAPGFAYADVPDVGASVFVVANDDMKLADEAAQDIHDLMWSLKEDLTKELPDAKKGVSEVIKMVKEGVNNIVISYHDDRLGDGTHVLRELIDQDAKNWISTCIADPAVLHKLRKENEVGDDVTVSIGGWLDPISGNPVEVTGRIEYLGSLDWTETGPMGKGAEKHFDLISLLDLGDNRYVLITESLTAPMSSDPLKALGLDLDNFNIVVLKDRVHHRAWWDTWSDVDYPVDPPGLGPANLSLLDYKYIPWDLYPIGGKYN
jgi:microcystin degradation protein MlrC